MTQMSLMSQKSRIIGGGWIALLVAALLLRLVALPAVPLAPDEAAQALSSLDAVRGAGWPATAESPALLMGNALLFAVFGAGDGIARLLPALAGAALVGVPFLWRKRLGEGAAWVAALLLAVSPLGLFASRQLDATSLGVLGAALLLTVLLDFDAVEIGDAKLRATLITLGLGLGITGGPAFYNLLLGGGFAWLMYAWFSGEWAPFQAQLWLRALLAALFLALLIVSGFGLRWGAWGGLADGLSAWLSDWRDPGLLRGGPMFLMLYEPLTLLLVLLGMGFAIRRGDSFPLLLALCGISTMLLASFQPGAAPLALSAAVVPFALLSGYGISAAYTGVSQDSWQWIALHGGVAFFLWIPAGLALASHGRSDAYALPTSWNPTMLSLYLLLGGGIVFALQGLLAMLFTLISSTETIWRGVLLGFVLPVLVVQISFGWGLAFLHRTSAVEPAVAEAGSPDLWNLRQTVDDIALRRLERRDMVPLTIVSTDAAMINLLRWTLRDFSNLRVTSVWPDDGQGLLLVDAAQSTTAADENDWLGMSFVAMQESLYGIPACEQLFPPKCQALAKWYLYRKVPAEATLKRVILWERSP